MKRVFKFIIIVLINLIILSGIYIWFIISKYERLIYPNVYIDDVNIGTCSIEKAENILQQHFKEYRDNKYIIINIDNHIFNSSYEELCIRVNEKEVIEKAFNYGKDLNLYYKFKAIKFPEDNYLYSSVSIDEKCFENLALQIEKTVNIQPINATIQRNEYGSFTITSHKVGMVLDRDELKRKIIESVNRKEKNKEIEIKITLKEKVPVKTKEELGSIDTMIASYSTSMGNSSFQRKRNIEVATRYINGYVVMSGEEFSFNKVVGRTTREKGYESAKVIVGGEFVDDIGGGICQVSSTLYNAILKTDMEITERRNHSKEIHYVPLGQDAMIYYGYSDFKFVNVYDFPIYIEGLLINNEVEFRIYCNSDVSGKFYLIKTPIIKVIPPKTEICYDYNMSNGEMVIDEIGKDGYILETYREVYENGILINKEFISKSIYGGKNKIIRKGKR